MKCGKIFFSFPELACKIYIFRKPRTLSRCNNIVSRNVVNPNFFSGEIPKHPFTRTFLNYMAGPLLKSRRRPCTSLYQLIQSQ